MCVYLFAMSGGDRGRKKKGGYLNEYNCNQRISKNTWELERWVIWCDIKKGLQEKCALRQKFGIMRNGCLKIFQMKITYAYLITGVDGPCGDARCWWR
jgi:hypothetical protein